MIIGSSCAAHFSINLLKTPNWSRAYLIARLTNKDMVQGGILTEKARFTTRACMNIDSPGYKLYGKYLLRNKCFYIAFNKLTNFIKG